MVEDSRFDSLYYQPLPLHKDKSNLQIHGKISFSKALKITSKNNEFWTSTMIFSHLTPCGWQAGLDWLNWNSKNSNFFPITPYSYCRPMNRGIQRGSIALVSKMDLRHFSLNFLPLMIGISPLVFVEH